MNRRLPIALIFLIGGAMPGPAAEAPAEAAAEAGPETGVARHRDWLLDCRAACTLATSVEGPDGRPLLRVSVGPSADVLTIETPLPLHLPDGLEVTAGARAPAAAPWRTCAAGGCEARAVLDQALLEGLRREREGAVAFTLADGARVRLPLSLMGFAAGERALRAAAAER
jgi:invasion protein IalB